MMTEHITLIQILVGMIKSKVLWAKLHMNKLNAGFIKEFEPLRSMHLNILRGLTFALWTTGKFSDNSLDLIKIANEQANKC
ncbi:hypothetical protein CXF72_12875 [Psychromonas sp. MB-3u-54]|nr:hypothetical protein CXF72_12875 [Psychromonas sp. MB-3u-54]